MWRADDLDQLAQWYADPELMKWMVYRRRADPGPPGVMTREEAQYFLERDIRHWEEHGFGVWAAEEKARGRLIGRVGLSLQPHIASEPEAGWLLDRDFWGKGLATEGARAALRFGFEEVGMERIVAATPPGNHRSIAVMQRIGMCLDCEMRLPDPGVELVVYAIARSTWQAAPPTSAAPFLHHHYS